MIDAASIYWVERHAIDARNDRDGFGLRYFQDARVHRKTGKSGVCGYMDTQPCNVRSLNSLRKFKSPLNGIRYKLRRWRVR